MVGAVLAVVCFGLGRRLYSAAVGLAFAALVLTRPVLLGQDLDPSIDLPFMGLVLGAAAIVAVSSTAPPLGAGAAGRRRPPASRRRGCSPRRLRALSAAAVDPTASRGADRRRARGSGPMARHRCHRHRRRPVLAASGQRHGGPHGGGGRRHRNDRMGGQGDEGHPPHPGRHRGLCRRGPGAWRSSAAGPRCRSILLGPRHRRSSSSSALRACRC